MSLIDSIKSGIDPILAVRNTVGAIKSEVYLVRRIWTGPEAGKGDYQDEKTLVYPQPRIVDYSQSLRVIEGGVYKQGDLMIKGISKNRYERHDIDGSQPDKWIDMFFQIDNDFYRVVSITEKYATWSVQVRKQTPKI